MNTISFWGTITEVTDTENGVYETTDKDETKHHVERHDLWHRKRHIQVFGHARDNKVHDRHTM